MYNASKEIRQSHQYIWLYIHMRKLSLTTLICGFILSSIFFISAATQAYAVPIRTVGEVNAQSGNYVLKSENGGNGNLQVGSSVTVDSYLFQCKLSGTVDCSTEWNSDAVLVQKWQNILNVPPLNTSTSRVTHNFSTLPFGSCGRVQYDQGVVGISGAVGGWVYNFGKDCPGATPSASPIATCADQQPLNTQFRRSGATLWVSGQELMGQNVRVGDSIDVNCFAKNGSALLNNAVITITLPAGQTYQLANSPELRNYSLPASGTYQFTCSSATLATCADTDSFSTPVLATPLPTPLQTPLPTPILYPTPTPTSQLSSCDTLQTVSGENNTVPAQVAFRASGSDNMGSIQAYRFYFGDGTQVESATPEVTHQYNASGTFRARAEIKDSRGNYKTASGCETNVRVQPSFFESHKSACSDLFLTASNSGKAPSVINATVSGYDNKGSIGAYRVDFGNGSIKESSGTTFEQRYDQAGTFEIKAYIKDNNGNWIGGTDNCHHTMSIGSSTPLTTQPSTGTPTIFPLMGLASGCAGVALQFAKSKQRA